MPDIAEKQWTESDDKNTEQQPNGFPGNMPAFIDSVGRMVMGAVKRFWRRINPYYLTNGSADAYTVIPDLSPTRINQYEILNLRIDRANTTTAPSLKFGRSTTHTIYKIGPSGKVPVGIGDMVAGASHSFWFDGTDYILANPFAVQQDVIPSLIIAWLASLPNRPTGDITGLAVNQWFINAGTLAQVQP